MLHKRKLKLLLTTLVAMFCFCDLNAIVSKTNDYVLLKLKHETIRLSYYGEGILRTQIYKGADIKEHWNPSVVAKSLKTDQVTVEEDGNIIIVRMPGINVKVNKRTGHMAYYNAQNKLLTQTSNDGGYKFSKNENGGVSQQFLVSENEHLYGVGQYVHGLPYVNGTGCTLAQTNMEDAAHVVVSDRGYAMFWNNPSGGQFEAFGKQELLSGKYVRTLDGKKGFQALYYPGDSSVKTEHLNDMVKSKITNTIDITSSNASVDVMQSDFDAIARKKTLSKKKTDNGISLLYKGILKTPNRTGWYYFNIGNSGRGVRFVIDGDRVVERRIHHGYSWNCGRKWLEASTEYPFELYYSHGDKHMDLQLYWDPNADIYRQYTWKSNCWSDIDYFIYADSNVDGIMNKFYSTTGRPSILPKWSLAYIHCQAMPFSPRAVDGFPREQFLSLAKNYREKQIPCDMLVQDFQWWTAMGSHVFRPDCYPDFQSRLQKIHEDNFKLMISVWPLYQNFPGEGYKGKLTKKDLHNRTELQDKGLMIGNDWVNYVKEEARDLAWKQIEKSLYNDSIRVDAFWLDADEGGAKDPNYSDAYPLLNKMSFRNGTRGAYPNTRTFLLGRSMYPGSQRYDMAMWSGDVGNDFWTLQRQVQAGLSVSMCGIPYWTTDVGGFGGGFARDTDYSNGKDDPSDPVYREVVTRWFQYGMFCPIFRVHRADNNSAPWFYGNETETNIANTIRFRYRLMPYVYSMTKRTRDDGYNPMRPLFMDFGQDKNVLDITQQFMYGDAFLVCPVTEPLYHPYHPNVEEQRKQVKNTLQYWKVYLPAGTNWYDFKTGEKIKGGQAISSPAPMDWMPLFVKEGSIVPMGNVIQNTTSEKQTEFELRIYSGKDADFTLYDDDGVSYDYEKGDCSQIKIHWDDKTRTLTIGKREGTFKGMPEKLIFKPVIVTNAQGIGSLNVYDGEACLEYTGDSIVWKYN